VLDLLRRLGGETQVRLLFAVSPFQGAVGTVEVDYETALDVAREAMERLAATHRPAFGDRLETEVRRGFPRPEIRAEIDAWRPGLVALGTHGRGGYERLMLGSVAEEVVRHSLTSVLVVPPRTRADAA
jgi:nucleotide-binding universal stress UspA family protein